MPQEPIFSPSDPRTQNLYSRYTQEQVPVLPAGYLESFANIARLRAEQEMQAAKLSDERHARMIAAEENQRNYMLSMAKTHAEQVKYGNESQKLNIQLEDMKNKGKREDAESKIKVAEFKANQLTSGIEILKTQKSAIEKQIYDDGELDENDPKKLKPEQLDSLKQQQQSLTDRINTLGNTFLSNAGLSVPQNVNSSNGTSVGGSVSPRLAPPANKPPEDDLNSIINEARKIAQARYQSSGSTNPQDLQLIYNAVLTEKLNEKKNKVINQTPVPAGSSTKPVSVFDGLIQDPNQAVAGAPIGTSSAPTGNEGQYLRPVSETVKTPSELNPDVGNHVNHGIQRPNGNPIHSTILFDANANDGQGAFVTSVNPDQSTNQFAVGLNRKLEYTTWLLNTKGDKLRNDPNFVKIDENDIKATADLLGVPENSSQLSLIAKAFKLATQTEQVNKSGSYDAKIDALNMQFNEQFGLEPIEFFAKGRGGIVKSVVPEIRDTNDIPRLIEQSANQQALTSKQLSELGEVPTQPPGVQERIDQIEKRLRRNASLVVGASASDQKAMNAESSDLSKELTALQAKMTSYQMALSARQAKEKQIKDRQDSFKSLGESYSAYQQAILKQTEISKQIVEEARLFPGFTTESRNQFNGYMATALGKNSGYVIPIDELDANGKPTGRKINETLTVRKALELALKNSNPRLLPDIYRVGTPTEKQVSEMQERLDSYNKALFPMRTLAGLSRHLSQSGPLSTFTEKMFGETVNSVQSLRNSIISAIRTQAIGGGNPSNYEQELLQELVPDPASIKNLSSRDVQRWKNAALVLVLGTHLMMSSRGMTMTDEALDLYNQQLSSVIGKKLTRNDFEDLYTAYKNSKTTYSQLEANGQAETGRQAIKDLISKLDNFTK